MHWNDTIVLLSATAAASLINAVAKGIVLTVFVSLFLRWCPGVKPSSRFIIWTGVLLTALAFHFVPWKNNFDHSLTTHTNGFQLDIRWGVAIVCVWGIFTLTRLMRLVQSAISLRRIATGATPLTPEPAWEILLRNGRRPAVLCTSTEVDRPSVVGFFRPRVLIPHNILSHLAPHELEQIILHEMEHLRRGDDWTNLVQKIGLALFPLNPAVNWIERRLCMERELACDDCVLAITSAHKTYASCLTNLAEHSLLRRNASLVLGAWGRKPELVQRVHRILSRPRSTMGRTAGYVVTGIFLFGLLGGAVSLTRIPALVSFSLPSSISATTAPAATNVSLLIQQSHQFSPTLVKAIMPQEQPSAVAHRVRAHRAPAEIKVVRRQSRPKPRNLLVLTEPDEQRVFPRLTLTVSESTGSSYAAVPVGNGWLVIQL